LPHAVDDHQTSNARYLADRGAATLIAQKDLSAPALADLLRHASRPALMEQAVRARALARTEAAQAVAEICAGFAPEGAR
jgi:UDP-N-acetylglucosamine--N-acetylmuramyl-(pentapeptide) pyrophosphoryl-undecaprenol N-acetylglucosamine transferase